MTPEAEQQRIRITQAEQRNKPGSAESTMKLSLAKTLIPELQRMAGRSAGHGPIRTPCVMSSHDPVLQRERSYGRHVSPPRLYRADPA